MADWLRYSNQGATRNKPLSGNLVNALSFLPDLGVTMNVISGGQDATGPNRTGSTRHDHGNSVDADFYVGDRKLDPANMQDRGLLSQIVSQGRANGLTGFGEGADYMGAGRMHLGYGPESVWGAGGKGANAPDWLRAAYNGTPQGAAPAQAQPVSYSTRGAPEMAQQQAPQGILGALGLQKRDEAAGGQTAMPFGQRDNFKDLMGNLAMGFNAMRLNPDANLAQNVQGQRAGRRDAQQKNRTIEWLRSQPGGEQFAAMAEAAGVGPALAAYQQSMQAPNPMDAVQLETAQFKLDQLRNPQAPAPDFEGQATLRKEFTSLPIVKSFSDQATAYGRVMASVNDPSPAGDLALIFNFMKVLDPGSTVREGEFATAANSGGVDDRVRALYNNVTEGTRLAPNQRDDFATRATKLYSSAEQQYRGISDQYAQFATQSGFDPATMLPDFAYSGAAYETPASLKPPQLAASELLQLGITVAEWPEIWAGMTDEQRADFGGSN